MLLEITKQAVCETINSGPKITDWIQAICATAGLLGLSIYAWDTNKLRRATSAQSDASRRPFFILKVIIGEYNFIQYNVENIGMGIALDVSLQYVAFKNVNEPRKTGRAVPVGAHIELEDFHSISFMEETWAPRGGLYITYSDTAGKFYWTEITKIRPHSGPKTGEVRTGEIEEHVSFTQRIERWNKALEG